MRCITCACDAEAVTPIFICVVGEAAMSAKYPKGECNRIMQDSLLSPNASEGGSIPASRLPQDFQTNSYKPGLWPNLEINLQIHEEVDCKKALGY